MPDQPKTPIRGVRIPDELWRAVQDRAAADDVTVSEVVRTLLAEWVAR